MAERAEAIAGKFDQRRSELNKVVEGLSDADWKKVTSAEKWPVGVVAHHLAMAYGSVADLVRVIAKGQAVPPRTMDMVHENNAKHAKEHANTGKAETLALLKSNGAKAAGIIRGLSDADLDRSATVVTGMPPFTATQVIERILINHTDEHMGSIKAAISAK
jgi:DinB family protein